MSKVPDTDPLGLVGEALSEIDGVPLDSTIRRVVRIANLIGDSEAAIRFSLELRGRRGAPPMNAEDVRQLMTDPGRWAESDSDAERALEVYMADRSVGKDRIRADSVGQMIEQEVELSELLDGKPVDLDGLLEARQEYRELLRLLKQRAFVKLLSWERALTYSRVNASIWARFQAKVDRSLAEGAPEILDQFIAAQRRLADASRAGNPAAGEELSQAVATCRRILKAVVDHVLPGAPGATSDGGHALNDAAYRNRLHEFAKQRLGSATATELLEAQFAGVVDRFEATDKLANKGVHADVAHELAELCAIQTYILAGEILAVAEGGDPGV